MAARPGDSPTVAALESAREVVRCLQQLTEQIGQVVAASLSTAPESLDELDDLADEACAARRVAKARLLVEALPGTEWTAPRANFSIAVVPDVEQPGLVRLVRYDARGPCGHVSVPPADVAEEILMTFGSALSRCDGAFDRLTAASTPQRDLEDGITS